MRLSVTELNNQIKAIVESHFDIIEVEAEISQVTYHHTGHIYFSIKDEGSILNCAMWKSNANRLKFKLEAGQKVVIYGALSVYTPRGEYKLIASKITPAGVGDLQFAYEQLKKELLQKGYFNEENKKPLPKYPKKVAIITAIPSAALSDMLKIASKRWPLVKFYLYNSLMQGENAKFDVVENLKKADKKSYDAIVIARGGGSLEDLWTFNTIEVANAIFEAKTPIISAIGHEVDVLISDYVADKRASTPSNAMEILLPDINEHFFMLDDLKTQFNHKISHILHKKEQELINLRKLYQINSIENEFKNKFEELNFIKAQFNYKINLIIERKNIMLREMRKNINQQIKYLINKKENELNNLKNQFCLNNPEKKEKKGFVEITKNSKRVLLNELKKGDIIKLNDTKVQRSAIIN
jgi:exodeoxyribonuclease VII large subunit